MNWVRHGSGTTFEINRGTQWTKSTKSGKKAFWVPYGDWSLTNLICSDSSSKILIARKFVENYLLSENASWRFWMPTANTTLPKTSEAIIPHCESFRPRFSYELWSTPKTGLRRISLHRTDIYLNLSRWVPLNQVVLATSVVLHGSSATWFQTSSNSINWVRQWVRHGSSTTFETGLSNGNILPAIISSK